MSSIYFILGSAYQWRWFSCVGIYFIKCSSTIAEILLTPHPPAHSYIWHQTSVIDIVLFLQPQQELILSSTTLAYKLITILKAGQLPDPDLGNVHSTFNMTMLFTTTFITDTNEPNWASPTKGQKPQGQSIVTESLTKESTITIDSHPETICFHNFFGCVHLTFAKAILLLVSMSSLRIGK